MKFGSLFSGIGGFEIGFERAGMTCSWQVETDDWCNQTLIKHWPDVPKYKDVRDVGKENLESVDLISGGFPCQDISVAGRRKGLAGKRSGLWFEFHRILEETHPRWAIIENVPGLLSSNEGQDFAIILRGLANLGYGVAYRVLDAQYFGVAQRRRRVFIIGSLGDYSSVEILFESESLRRNSKARKEKRKIAPTISASGAGTSRTGNQRTEAEMIIPAILGSGKPSSRRDDEDSLIISNTIAKGNRNNPENETFIAAPLRSRNSPGSNMPGRGGEDDENIVLAIHENQRAEIRMSEKAPELTTGGGKPGQGYPSIFGMIPGNSADARSIGVAENISPTIRGGGGGAKSTIANQEIGVRRLTPIECERLQGFPDGWTEDHSDTRRYKMIGNAVCVPVIEWIGRRIMEFDGT